MGLPTLGGQYPVFPAKLLEEGKMHAVEHLMNPLALQHEHASAQPTVMPAVSTPPPFQVHTPAIYTPSTLQVHTHTHRCRQKDVRTLHILTQIYTYTSSPQKHSYKG